MKKLKLKLISDKNLRCPNCGHFKLHFIEYESKYRVLINCNNCGAEFETKKIDLVRKYKQSLLK